MVIPPLVGMYQCQRQRLEPRYTISYLTLLAVGLGSILFHGTLLYEMQLLDEIPMIIATSHMIYCLIEVNSVYNVISRKGYWAILGLTTYSGISTVVYLFVKDHSLFEAIFGLLVLVLLISGVYCVWKYGQCRHKGWVIACIAMLALGFTLWNIDVHFCPSLRKARQHMFLGRGDFITQFHSWWHLLAGLGAYLHVLSSSRLRMEVLGYRTEIKTCLGLPYLTVLRRIDL